MEGVWFIFVLLLILQILNVTKKLMLCRIKPFYFQKHLGISPKSGRKYSSNRRNHGGNRETVWLKLSPWPHPRTLPLCHFYRWTLALMIWCISTVILWWENVLLSFYVFPKHKRTSDLHPKNMRRFTNLIPLVQSMLFSNIMNIILCKALLQILL